MTLVSRQEALRAGHKSYFTGKPCKHGHIAKRQTCDGACRPCKYASIARQRAADPKKFARRRRKWRDCASRNEQRARHKARRRNQVCQCCTAKQVESIYKVARQRKITVDHIIPLAKGGLHCAHNMQLLPHIENSQKGARYDPLIEGVQYLQNLGLA